MGQDLTKYFPGTSVGGLIWADISRGRLSGIITGPNSSVSIQLPRLPP